MKMTGETKRTDEKIIHAGPDGKKYFFLQIPFGLPMKTKVKPNKKDHFIGIAAPSSVLPGVQRAQ